MSSGSTPILVDQPTLSHIIADELNVPAGQQAIDFLPGLQANLGSTDSDLRENSLDVLWTWLVKGLFDHKTTNQLSEQMSCNLKIGLGEQKSDSVFLRAFSALILGCTLEMDIEQRKQNNPPLFTNNQIHTWLKTTLELLTQENDLRGFVQGKGWAHCAAHTGDLLAQFANHPSADQQTLEEILNSLQARFLTPVDHVFVHNEDERLASVVIHILRRQLVANEFLKNWLDRFLTPHPQMDWVKAFTDPQWNCARVNTKSFLRAIYFFLVFGDKSAPMNWDQVMNENLEKMVLNTLKQIYPNSRYSDN